MIDHPAILRAQYHATLDMLKQAIEKCPPELWNDSRDRNKFWQLAYHVLFYTHLYLHTSGEEFTPWEHHHPDYEQLGAKPWPPYELPKIGEPYTPEEILTFLEVCWAFVTQQVSALDLEATSGFSWLPYNKLELQIYNIRHLQLHTGELMERLGSRVKLDVEWRGSIS